MPATHTRILQIPVTRSDALGAAVGVDPALSPKGFAPILRAQHIRLRTAGWLKLRIAQIDAAVSRAKPLQTD